MNLSASRAHAAWARAAEAAHRAVLATETPADALEGARIERACRALAEGRLPSSADNAAVDRALGEAHEAEQLDRAADLKEAARLIVAHWRERASTARDALWLSACWARSAQEAVRSGFLDAADRDLDEAQLHLQAYSAARQRKAS